MTRPFHTLAIALVGAFWVTAPAAAQTQMPEKPPADQPANRPSPDSPRTPDVDRIAYTASISGEVTEIDQDSGMLVVSTDDGPVSVHFPPDAVQKVKVGDRVTVAFGITVDSDDAAASPPTEPESDSSAPPDQGQLPSPLEGGQYLKQ
jgi:hypothetical protein